SPGAGQSWEETQAWAPPPPPPPPPPSGGYPGQPGQGTGGYDRDRPSAPQERGAARQTGGYEGYATSRVHGAPSTPRGEQGGPGKSGKRRRPGPVLIAAIIAVLAVVAAAVVIFVVRGNNKPVAGFVPNGSTPEQDAQQLTA